jgi:hypothetical protein
MPAIGKLLHQNSLHFKTTHLLDQLHKTTVINFQNGDNTMRGVKYNLIRS